MEDIGIVEDIIIDENNPIINDGVQEGESNE